MADFYVAFDNFEGAWGLNVLGGSDLVENPIVLGDESKLNAMISNGEAQKEYDELVKFLKSVQ